MDPDFYIDPKTIPTEGGAYVLLIRLRKLVQVQIAGRPPMLFGSGRYLYCGSAYGPGGLRARLRRHMRRHKAIRWHVDHLTTRGAVLGAWAYPGGDEHRLVAQLAPLPAPHAGFGSSDCKAGCVSHLFAWPPGAPLHLPEGLRTPSAV